jgi:hypothetical protein
VQIAPSATFYSRLADLRESSGADPLPDLKRAAALDPASAERLLRLGLRAELAGDLALAERSLLRAATLSRLYQPRYLLAQYYFRRQNADSFWKWSREALETSYGDVSLLLDLCWRTRPEASWLEEHAFPRRPEIARQYLVFLVRHRESVAAGTLARQIVLTATDADLPALLEYGDSRLSEGDGTSAADMWNAVCRRGLLPCRPLDRAAGAAVTNGDFAHRPTEVGFDWRTQNAPGVIYNYSAGELRLTFSGHEPEKCHLVLEYLPLERGRRYRLRFQTRAIDAPSADGLGWSIFDHTGAETVPQRLDAGILEFNAPAELVRLVLQYERPPGEPRLEGTVAVTGVRLEKEP